MNCIRCGHPLPPGSFFCSNCGQKYEVPVPYETNPQAQPQTSAPAQSYSAQSSFPAQSYPAQGSVPVQPYPNQGSAPVQPYPAQTSAPVQPAPDGAPKPDSAAADEKTGKRAKLNPVFIICAVLLILSVGAAVFILLRGKGPKQIPTFLVYTKEDGYYVQLQSMEEGVRILETDEKPALTTQLYNYFHSYSFFFSASAFQLCEDRRTLYFCANYQYNQDWQYDGRDFYGSGDLYRIDLKKNEEAELIESDVTWFQASRNGRTVHYLTTDGDLRRYQKSSGKSTKIQTDVLAADISFDGTRVMCIVGGSGEDTLEFFAYRNGKLVFSEEDVLLDSLRLDAEGNAAVYAVDEGDGESRLYHYAKGKTERLGKNCYLTGFYFLGGGYYDGGTFYYSDGEDVWYWNGKKSLELDVKKDDDILSISRENSQKAMFACYNEDEGILLFKGDKCTCIEPASSKEEKLENIWVLCLSTDDKTGYFIATDTNRKENIYVFDLTEKNPTYEIYAEDVSDFIGVVGNEPLFSERDSSDTYAYLCCGDLDLFKTQYPGDIEWYWFGARQSMFYLRGENVGGSYYNSGSFADKPVSLWRCSGSDAVKLDTETTFSSEDGGELSGVPTELSFGQANEVAYYLWNEKNNEGAVYWIVKWNKNYTEPQKVLEADGVLDFALIIDQAVITP